MFNISIAQIKIWIWSNVLHNSRGNQINIAQITILQLLLTNQIKCWFLMRRENRSTRAKTSHGRVENQQTQSTWHRVQKSTPNWWKASALNTRLTCWITTVTYLQFWHFECCPFVSSWRLFPNDENEMP